MRTDEDRYIRYTAYRRDMGRMNKIINRLAVVIGLMTVGGVCACLLTATLVGRAYGKELDEMAEALSQAELKNEQLGLENKDLNLRLNNISFGEREYGYDRTVKLSEMSSNPNEPIDSKYITLGLSEENISESLHEFGESGISDEGSESEKLEATGPVGEELVEVEPIEPEEVESEEAEPVVVDTQNLRVQSNANEHQLNELLEGTNLENHGEEFLEAESKYNVNAIILMSIMKQESSLGARNAAQYNTAGMKTGSGKWRPFSSFQECIEALAELLDRQYLSEDGAYHNGKSIKDVNVRFCLTSDGQTDWNWSKQVIKHSQHFVAMANQSITAYN